MDFSKYDSDLIGKCIDMIILQASLVSDEYLDQILNSPELLNSLIEKMLTERENRLQHQN